VKWGSLRTPAGSGHSGGSCPSPVPRLPRGGERRDEHRWELDPVIFEENARTLNERLGSLAHELRNQPVAERVQVHAARRSRYLTARVVAGHVRIEVADQCGGLPAGWAEQLFLPFTQGGADRSGVGLGLSISRRAVHAIGGTLEVRDVPGTGCGFTLDLPPS
jgi:K+-sensing histidine kinase KdpD